MEQHARFAPGSRGRLLHALGLVLAAAAVMMISFGALLPAIVGDFEAMVGAGPEAFALVGAMAALQLIGVVGIGLIAVSRLNPKALGWRADGLGAEIALGLLGALGLVGLMLVTVVIFGVPVGEMIDGVLGWGPQQRALFACIGLTAALTEESVFRGYLQPELTRRLGRWPGVAVGAAIFSVYHLNFRPISLVSKFTFGLLLGALREREGTLVAPAIAHGVFWIIAGFA